MLDDLITRLKYFLSGIEGILSLVQFLPSMPQFSSVEAFKTQQNDQSPAVRCSSY